MQTDTYQEKQSLFILLYSPFMRNDIANRCICNGIIHSVMISYILANLYRHAVETM